MSLLRALLFALLIASVPLVPAVGVAADPPDIPLTIANNRFQPDEIKVKAGEGFVLISTDKDKNEGEVESRDLRIEKVIPASKTVRLKMPALKAGTYSFVGEYNEKTAKGKIVAE